MAEVRTTSSTGGQKGTKLARFDLIPTGPLTELAEHYGRGAAKYANHQWRQGYEWSKSYAALMRHLVAFWSGLDYDVCSNEPDNCKPWADDLEHESDTCFNHTGSHHMAAVAWHAFLLLEFKDAHQGHDDRYVAERPTMTQAADELVSLAEAGMVSGPDIQIGDETYTSSWLHDYDTERLEARMHNFPRVETGLPTLAESFESNGFAIRAFEPYDDSWLQDAVRRQVLAVDKAVEDRLREQYGPDLLSKRKTHWSGRSEG